jgi:hypothetical protein
MKETRPSSYSRWEGGQGKVAVEHYRVYSLCLKVLFMKQMLEPSPTLVGPTKKGKALWPISMIIQMNSWIKGVPDVRFQENRHRKGVDHDEGAISNERKCYADSGIATTPVAATNMVDID